MFKKSYRKFWKCLWCWSSIYIVVNLISLREFRQCILSRKYQNYLLRKFVIIACFAQIPVLLVLRISFSTHHTYSWGRANNFLLHSFTDMGTPIRTLIVKSFRNELRLLYIGLQLCVFSQLLGIFSKQTWLKVLLSWYKIVKKTWNCGHFQPNLVN